MEKVSQKYVSTPFQKWRRKASTGCCRGQSPRPGSWANAYSRNTPCPQSGGTWKHVSRESSEVCGPVTAKCLPFLPLEWQDYSQYSDCVSLQFLGVWGQTTCLSISNSKGSRSREAISVPDGDYRILVCKADSMIRCDLWGSGESKNAPPCQREANDGGVNSGWCENGLCHVTFDGPPLWVSSAHPLIPGPIR